MATAPNSKTLKFMIFILVFLITVMLFVFLVVIPSIKTFKSKKAHYLHQLKMEERLRSKQTTLQQEYNRTVAKYAEKLKAFEHPFDKNAFLETAGHYFNHVTLTAQGAKKSESGLQIYRFQADFDANTPLQFYHFVDALQKMESVVKINFPIEVDAQNSKIHLRFNISVYQL